MAEATVKNLYQRLLDITEEVGAIEKTGRNAQQGYAFIEQSRVVAELRPLLHRHGVAIIPETVGRTLERYDVTRGNGKSGVDIHVQVASRYTLVNADSPDDRIVCEWDAGEAIDSSDKATNKAVTASDKTFLMKLFNISDQDDPDQDTTPAASSTQRSYTNAPSEKQLELIKSLSDRLGIDNAISEQRIALLATKSEASTAIDKLQTALEKKEEE